MVPKSAIELSDELLFSRAASVYARLDENIRQRQRALEQLECMFELGTDFRRGRRTTLP
jgi:hypothetical protein